MNVKEPWEKYSIQVAYTNPTAFKASCCNALLLAKGGSQHTQTHTWHMDTTPFYRLELAYAEQWWDEVFCCSPFFCSLVPMVWLNFVFPLVSWKAGGLFHFFRFSPYCMCGAVTLSSMYGPSVTALPLHGKYTSTGTLLETVQV